MIRRIARLARAPELVIALSTTRMTSALGNSLLIVLLPIYVATLPPESLPMGRELLIGVMISAFGLITAVSQPLVARIGDAMARRKPMLQVGLLVMAAATLGFVIFDHWLAIVALRAIQGFGVACILVSGLSLITGVTSVSDRGNAMGIWGTMGMVGFSLGPLLGGAVQVTLGFDAAFLLGSAFIVAAWVLVVRTVHEPDAADATRIDPGERSPSERADRGTASAVSPGPEARAQRAHDSDGSLRLPRHIGAGDPSVTRGARAARRRPELDGQTGVLSGSRRRRGPLARLDLQRPPKVLVALACGNVSIAMAFSALTTLENVINERLGQTALGYGLAFSALTLARLLFQIPVGRLTDRIGRRGPILAGLCSLAVLVALAGHVAASWQLVVLMFAIGASTSVVTAPLLALAGDLARADRVGRELSVVTIGFSLGLFVGPLAAGAIFESAGFATTFYILAAVPALAAVAIRLVAPARVPASARG